MKVIGINGSPRKEGNTNILIKMVFAELEAEGIETEIVQLSKLKIRGCMSCFKCFSNKDQKCAVKDDLNPLLEKLLAVDGILLGSPVYVASVTSEIKAFMDRACLVSTANGYMFEKKVGASVVAVRRAGAVGTMDTLNHFLLYNLMIIPGSTYWTLAIGRDPGDVEKDDEGVRTMKNLGKNMAWLLKKLN